MVTSGAPSAGLRVVSYGGGVQSTALLVLAAQGRVDFRVFLMANTGDDSEHPATLRYVREVAVPFAAQHDLELHLLDRTRRDGSVETVDETGVAVVADPGADVQRRSRDAQLYRGFQDQGDGPVAASARRPRRPRLFEPHSVRAMPAAPAVDVGAGVPPAPGGGL